MPQNPIFIPLPHSLNVRDLIVLFHYKYPRNYVFDGEQHNYWEFIYVDQGQIEITAGDKRIPLKSGEIAFHQPGEFHAVRTSGNTSASAIICSFTCDHPAMAFFRGYVATLSTKEREYLYEMVYLRTWLFFNASVPFRSSPRPIDKIPAFYLQLVQNYLERILLHILIRNQTQENISQDLSSMQTDSYHTVTQHVVSYMQQHLEEKLTLQQIADAVGYSVPSVKRLFYKDMQQGVMDYFTKLKIDEAKRIILQGDRSLSQIAFSLGFTDPGHFCRKFKQYEGMCPSDFRRICISHALFEEQHAQNRYGQNEPRNKHTGSPAKSRVKNE